MIDKETRNVSVCDTNAATQGHCMRKSLVRDVQKRVILYTQGTLIKDVHLLGQLPRDYRVTRHIGPVSPYLPEDL